MSFQFMHITNERAVGLKVEDDDSTWTHLTEQFKLFLLGCGYLFDEKDERNFDRLVDRLD